VPNITGSRADLWCVQARQEPLALKRVYQYEFGLVANGSFDDSSGARVATSVRITASYYPSAPLRYDARRGFTRPVFRGSVERPPRCLELHSKLLHGRAHAPTRSDVIELER